MKTHGLSKTIFYKVWRGLVDRTSVPSNKDYLKYGGRGIRNEWKKFEDFYDDMYVSYLEHKESNTQTSLDRRDVNGNYSKENCRWATNREQLNNTRVNHPVTFRGVTKNIKQWAQDIGTDHQALIYRLKNGWTIEETMTIPFKHSNKINNLRSTSL